MEQSFEQRFVVGNEDQKQLLTDIESAELGKELEARSKMQPDRAEEYGNALVLLKDANEAILKDELPSLSLFRFIDSKEGLRDAVVAAVIKKIDTHGFDGLPLDTILAKVRDLKGWAKSYRTPVFNASGLFESDFAKCEEALASLLQHRNRQEMKVFFNFNADRFPEAFGIRQGISAQLMESPGRLAA